MPKKFVTEYLDCDTSRLYDDLPKAIEYLKEVHQKYPEASLHEHWTGYEDMEMVFIYSRPETEEEEKTRLRLERQKKEEERRAAEEHIKRQEKLALLNKLKRELGIR
jgi:hypothetical protein